MRCISATTCGRNSGLQSRESARVGKGNFGTADLANVRSRFFFLEQAKQLWEFWLAQLAPANTEANRQRQAIAQAANVEQLEPLHDLSMIDTYAKAYGKLPREVSQEPFDEFIPYFVLWQRQSDYYERYEAQKKFLDGTPKS